MEAKLVVVAGEAKQGEYKLQLPVVIGRSRKSDLTLGHPLVSRQHCELYEVDGALMVRDLGSLNGTFVGDSRIASETALDPGALLTIGTITFKAVYGAVQQKPSARFARKAGVVAEPAEADIQQTLQADGLAALEQMRESHAAPEPPDELEELDWMDEGGPSSEEPVVELEEIVELEAADEVETLQVEDLQFEEAPDAPKLVDDLDSMPIDVDSEDQALGKPAKGKAAAKPAPDDLDDFFKSME